MGKLCCLLLTIWLIYKESTQDIEKIKTINMGPEDKEVRNVILQQ